MRDDKCASVALEKIPKNTSVSFIKNISNIKRHLDMALQDLFTGDYAGLMVRLDDLEGLFQSY